MGVGIRYTRKSREEMKKEAPGQDDEGKTTKVPEAKGKKGIKTEMQMRSQRRKRHYCGMERYLMDFWCLRREELDEPFDDIEQEEEEDEPWPPIDLKVIKKSNQKKKL